MKPIAFPEANALLGPPKGLETRVNALPVHTDGVVCTSIWELEPEELETVARTGKIILHVMSGGTQPPVLLEVFNERIT